MRETSRLIDPHTAVGLAVAEKEIRDPTRSTAIPMIVLGTAHPAKFPDAVQAACGVRPELPEWLGDLTARAERVTTMPVDQAKSKNSSWRRAVPRVKEQRHDR